MVELSPREREILTFERDWWKYADAKDAAARARLGLTPQEYYRALNHDHRPARRAGSRPAAGPPAAPPAADPAAPAPGQPIGPVRRSRRPLTPPRIGQSDGSGSPFGAFSSQKASGPSLRGISSSNVPLVEPLVTRDSSGSTHFRAFREPLRSTRHSGVSSSAGSHSSTTSQPPFASSGRSRAA